MKIDYEYLKGKCVTKSIIASAVCVLSMLYATSKAYETGVFLTCKRMEEKGVDPEELFNKED